MYISAIATSLPQPVVTTASLLDGLEHKLSPDLARTIRSLEIERRHTVLGNLVPYILGEDPEPTASTTTLAEEAARECLARAKVKPGAVGLLITCTNSQARIVPGLAPELLARMHDVLPTSLSAVNMQGQGCSGLLKAVEAAGWYLRANPGRQALLVVSEVQTPYTQRLTGPRYASFREVLDARLSPAEQASRLRDSEVALQAALFGDGAVAMLLSAEGVGAILSFGPICHLTNERAEDLEMLVIPEGGSDRPRVDGIPRYLMRPEVPQRGAAYATATLAAAMSQPGAHVSRLRDASACFIHTGSRKILDGVCAGLELPPGAEQTALAYRVLRRHANLSSASIGFMLAQHEARVGAGLIVSFGVGFSASATTFAYV